MKKFAALALSLTLLFSASSCIASPVSPVSQSESMTEQGTDLYESTPNDQIKPDNDPSSTPTNPDNDQPSNPDNGQPSNPDNDQPTNPDNGQPTNPDNDQPTEQPSKVESPENKIAMQAYQAAINGDICVFDEVLGEVKLKDCRFPSNNLRLDECDILYKAILDMDGDGINEYVIRSETKDHIVLRHYDGNVYSYCFDRMEFFNLNSNGSFFWVDSYDVSNCTRGCNQLTFDGASCYVKEIYRIKQTSPYDYGDGDHEYYVECKLTTREEFQDYYDSNCRRKNLTTFSPLDISCKYPISSEKACELAANYWGIKNGTEDGAAGTVYLCTIIILEKPNNDTLSYHIGWHAAGYTTHVIDDLFCQPPSSERIYEELVVDAITGECIPCDIVSIRKNADQAYLDVLENKIKIYDTQNENFCYLIDCKDPYSQTPLYKCTNLGYALVDLDGNTVNELVIECFGGILLLRYYAGTVFLYDFTFQNMSYLYTDGTYSWNHTGSDFEYGQKQLYFVGAKLRTVSLWCIVNDGEPNAEYYIGDRQVTEAEQTAYIKSLTKTKVTFSPLDFESSKLSLEEAQKVAENYWSRYEIEKNGYIVVNVQSDRAPSHLYVFVIKWFVIDHYSTFDEIWINPYTGEAIIPYSPDGKG